MKTGQANTDWERALAFTAGEIPYEEDGPYDPNDAGAARAWLAEADLVRNGKVVRRERRGPQKTHTKKLV